MKLPRYQAGATNVGLLESEKSALESPQEAAQAAGAPYAAVSDVLKVGQEAIERYNRVRAIRQEEDAKVAGATMDANRDAAYLLLKNDPDLMTKMEADPKYFESQVANIEADYREALNNIENPAIRERYRKAQKTALITFKAKATSDLMDLEYDIGKENVIRQGRSAEQAGLTDQAEAIYTAGQNYFNETEFANIKLRLQNSRIEVASDALADMADDAYQEGGEDALNKVREGVLNNDNLDDEVQEQALIKINAVESHRKKADKAERAQIELQQQQQKDKERLVFEYSITPSTEDAELNEFADAYDLSYPQRKQLFEIRNKQLQGAQSLAFGNPNDKSYRDGLDSATQAMTVETPNGELAPMPLEQQFETQISWVGDRFVADDSGEKQFVKGTNAIGTNLTNSIIQDVASPEPEVNLRALKWYAQIMQNNAATKLDFDADTDNFLRAAYNSAKNNGGTEEAYAKAAKEQRAIHVSQANGLDTAAVANATYQQVIVPMLLDNVGDRLETKGYDIPGWFNDKEFQYDATFQAVLTRAGKETAQYMMATEGRIDPQYVINMADQTAISRVSPNFINDGVPSGGQTFLTNKGEQKTVRLTPQLSVNTIDGADKPETAARLRALMRDDYVEGGTGLNGKKVRYNGREYTLKAKKPKAKMPSSLEMKMGYLPKQEIEERVIYIDELEMFTSATPRRDDNGHILADLRYLNIPIYSPDGKSFEAWNGYTGDGYFVPAGKTDVSGGPTRADVNPRIKQFENPDG